MEPPFGPFSFLLVSALVRGMDEMLLREEVMWIHQADLWAEGLLCLQTYTQGERIEESAESFLT